VTLPDAPFADAVILAAGSSTRMEGHDKLFMEVGGLPLLAWTVRAAAAARTVRKIVVVARADCLDRLAAEPWFRQSGAVLTTGGARRQDSVACGVEACDGEVVLIHDGARPLVSADLFDRVAQSARLHGAAVPVVAVPESMRRIEDGRIVGIIDRGGLYRSQTPHGIQRELLRQAYGRVDPRGPQSYVDETTLVSAAGIVVSPVPGEPTNLKVTLPGDELLAFTLLAARTV
jgi:2-C-methyl-D-erythritol 4-phosphate cytidylyltransferase